MTSFKRIATEKAPKAIGPYSQAVTDGHYLFVSGQLPIDPDTNQMIDGDLRNQTLQVFDNLEAVLNAYGLTFEDVIRVEVFLKDMNDFRGVNLIYAEKFTSSCPPARQTIQAGRLPLDAMIEISCIARCR